MSASRWSSLLLAALAPKATLWGCSSPSNDNIECPSEALRILGGLIPIEARQRLGIRHLTRPITVTSMRKHQ